MGNCRVLLVSPLPPPVGGITTWTTEYLKEMKSQGNQVTVVNSSVTGKRISVNRKINVIDEIKRMRLIRSGIKAALKAGDVDVIHYNASCFVAGLCRDFYVLFGIKRRTPIVYQCHCNLETNIHSSFSALLFRCVVKSVNEVLVLNEPSYRFAEKYSPKVSKVPNFVSDDEVGQNTIKDDLTDVAFVGRMDKKKGIDELICAFKSLRTINLHLIGPDSQGYLNDLDVPNIIHYGEVSHGKAMEFLKEMDALILPSYSEGFPLVILEAMTAGLPIIATDVGSIGEMIEDKGGILIEPKSSQSICNAVEAIRPAIVREKMHKFNIAKVRESYLCSSVVEQLNSIYSNIRNEVSV